ncbi:nicotinate phosphoribosyltransferase [Anoxynatronum buryatiense]|uniref:Nicotinate phosphoribosyltransferase n=1 Tax=Anoxynatronum buryatiense TaxID=489973 RepID=A0AA45WVW1_9CLOT|nr:nicotinate phosphoribosyltransferase [Anoxynatronum buryatiense]SMP56107.1 nicotinate phosphoribosyltransferase [Anoxynatronum buryatiense]
MRNLSMMTDYYQLSMMKGYLESGVHEDEVVFDLFFRKNPFHNSFTIVAGMESLIDYINGLSFTEDDLKYLASVGFDKVFLEHLRAFRFTGDIWGVAEGTIMFPHEPVIRVKASIFQAQLIETALLNIINFQSLIATKAARICEAAQGDPVFEFGLRRAQGPDAGIYGARAAYIGGCVSTSNVLAGKLYGIPVVGTHAHSWVQKFETELDAFRAYASSYPENCLLLVDTFNTIESGIPNAITVFRELQEKGFKPKGIRIDSGDIAYLSKVARRMLDDAGFPNTAIVASSDLDEDTIDSLKVQGAMITHWGVGTNLITSSNWPALGGVYKLAAAAESGALVPKIKISDNPEKITNPGLKKVTRIYDESGLFALADLIMLADETIDTSEPLTIFHPIYTWKTKTFRRYSLRELLEPLYLNGKLVYERRTVQEVRANVRRELDGLWPEYKRLQRPQIYKVDLSKKLWDLKHQMMLAHKE